MKVRATGLDPTMLPEELQPYARPGQVSLTGGKIYEVEALVMFRNFLALLIIDDREWPQWTPDLLFQVVDTKIPSDWICNVLNEAGVRLIIGPAFIAESEASYGAMVELERPQTDLFWQRVRAREKAEREAAELAELLSDDEPGT